MDVHVHRLMMNLKYILQYLTYKDTQTQYTSVQDVSANPIYAFGVQTRRYTKQSTVRI